MTTINEAEVRNRLKSLPGWTLTPEGIRKTFQRKDFKEAVRLVNAVAEAAEQVNHHPDILIFGWNKVTFTLMTHSERGVTEKDFALAAQIERAAQ